MDTYHVLGVDIGFSKTRSSSGVFVGEVRNRVLRAADGPYNLTSEAALVRARAAFARFPITVVAIDASVASTPQTCYRPVEMVFSRDRFQKHCKPGNTASTVGQDLHAAGMAMVAALGGLASYASFSQLGSRQPATVVEVFPTAALGVLVPRHSLAGVRRTTKSDALFELVWERGGGRIGCLRLDPGLRVQNHDQRMAVICAALAGLYVEERCTAIGEDASGYFLMPHLGDWLEEWQEALNRIVKQLPIVQVWSSSAASNLS